MADDIRHISLEAFLESEGIRRGVTETVRELERVGDAARRVSRDLDDEMDRVGQSLSFLGNQAIGTIMSAVSVDNFVDGLRTRNQLLLEGIELQRTFAKEAEEYRQQNVEVAGIKGQVPNREFLERQLRLQESTGATTQQATEFMKGFANEGQLAIGKNIDEAEAEEFQKRMLRWTVSRNFDDPERVGSVAGAALRKGDFRGPGGGERAFNEASQQVEILNIGSGDLTAVMKQANTIWQQLGSDDEMLGVFRNPAEAAFATSLAAQSNDRRAYTYVNQAARGLRGFGTNFQSSLEEAGITPQDSFVDALEKFAPWALKTSKEEGIPLDLMLKQRGLRDDEARPCLAIVL